MDIDPYSYFFTEFLLRYRFVTPGSFVPPCNRNDQIQIRKCIEQFIPFFNKFSDRGVFLRSRIRPNRSIRTDPAISRGIMILLNFSDNQILSFSLSSSNVTAPKIQGAEYDYATTTISSMGTPNTFDSTTRLSKVGKASPFCHL